MEEDSSDSSPVLQCLCAGLLCIHGSLFASVLYLFAFLLPTLNSMYSKKKINFPVSMEGKILSLQWNRG